MNTRQEFDYIIVGARSAGCVAVDLFAQPNLSKVRRVLPASDKEADIVAFIEQRPRANYHPACNCAIGRVVRLRSPGFRR
jgi:choline dehydrogenase-like flavoprotein